MGGGVGGFAHGDGVGIDEVCFSADERDAGRLHQGVNGSLKLADDGVLASHCLRQTELHIAGSDAQGFRMTCGFEHFGSMAEAFRRDAACIEAGSAQRPAFDDHGLQSCLCSMYGGFIASGACTNNYQLCLHGL